MKQENCTIKTCWNYGHYGRKCGHIGGSLSEPKPIKKLSEKRQKVQTKEYLPLVREILKKNPNCRIQSPVCTTKAQGLHHLAGRVGAKLTDKKYLIPACNPCNDFVERNPPWARANGFKLSKFSPEA
jgi:hypothetical protein